MGIIRGARRRAKIALHLHHPLRWTGMARGHRLPATPPLPSNDSDDFDTLVPIGGGKGSEDNNWESSTKTGLEHR